MREETGRVVRAISGFYDVQTQGGLVTCRARGNLRRVGTPLTGDIVRIQAEGERGTLTEILPRRNSFLRPAVANIDVMVVFAANTNPVTEPFLIDRVAAIAAEREVPVILCVNKCDVDPGQRLAEIYRNAGFPVIQASAETGQGAEELFRAIRGRLAVFTGNSGVGKSSMLNCLCPGLALPTGEVSEKLGRGRHTTRHVQLFSLGEDTYVADTPGFSSFDTEMMELLVKENLQYDFRDFAPYLGRCQFHDCTHRAEPGCAVREAVGKGLEQTRYESYLRLYAQTSQIRMWEIRKEEKKK